MLTGSSPDRYYRLNDAAGPMLGQKGCDDNLSRIALCDGWRNLEFGLHFSRNARVYRFPLETVSQSEDGQERVYQGSVVLPCWQLRIPPGAAESFSLTVAINDLEQS